ncbi:hypothetical protein [Sphingomonas sp. PvP056]|uniref:hypothetical protein n=1 Tax=Sphingomonas sp. PvP056 TaxID=3156392 RepID=UPI00339816A0
MGKIAKALRHIPYIDAILSFGTRIGLGAFLWNVAAVIAALLMAFWAYIWSNLPPWGLLLVFLTTVALLLFCVDKGMAALRNYTVARAMMKFDPTQYQAFGDELVALSHEIFRYLAERQRDHADIHKANPNREPGFGSWQTDRDFEAVTGKLFFERFGPKVLGSVALLHGIGIQMPPHMVLTAQTRPNGLPQFLGMIGDLLKREILTMLSKPRPTET